MIDKTANSPLLLADKDFIATNPELHHYTTLTGLRGIVESNSLWATHFANLNDAAEIVHLREPLKDALTTRFRTFLRERQRESFGLKRTIERFGGVNVVASDAARDLVSALYESTFSDRGAFTFAEPFISSFCIHTDEGYERENGLLSQWRGYGGGGGCCIVFDTKEMLNLLLAEFDAYYWIYMHLSPVHYALGDSSIEGTFQSLLERCEIFLANIVDGNSEMPESIDDGFAPFVAGATLYKHEGFREEREVRIVAIPGSQRLLAQVKSEHPNFEPPPLKVIKTRHETRGPRRYISLFESLSRTLPIKRIIVGPSLHQNQNFAEVTSFVGNRISIIKSATPFIG